MARIILVHANLAKDAKSKWKNDYDNENLTKTTLFTLAVGGYAECLQPKDTHKR